MTHLGSLPAVNPKVIEGLYSSDLTYLQKLYNRINVVEEEPLLCPHCGKPIDEGDAAMAGGTRPGEWSATPSIN